MPDARQIKDAMRVSRFMEDGEVGRWKLQHFSVDEDYHARDIFRAMHEAGDNEERRQMALSRVIPVGDYIVLKRRAIQAELEGESGARIELGGGYVPVMSDTPAEIDGHDHAVEHATGRVLIGGLGLGCLVAGLLAKPDVTHIDVIEVDPDVIALTGPYYNDERVTIHHCSIHEFTPGPDDRWDYVWHDIWTHISDRNLDPAEAEHGISYGMMFDRFEPYARMQGAWAYEEARIMEANNRRQEAENAEWEERFFAADFDGKVDMVFEQQVREHLVRPDGRQAIPQDQPVPQQFLDFFENEVGMRTFFEEAIREAIDNGRLTPEALREWRSEPEPLGRPNEETAA